MGAAKLFTGMFNVNKTKKKNDATVGALDNFNISRKAETAYNVKIASHLKYIEILKLPPCGCRTKRAKSWPLFKRTQYQI